MRGTKPLLITLLVVVSVGIVPGVVVAEDDWADACRDANIVDQTSISGHIDHPNDRDYFLLEATEGDYLTISAIFPDEATSPLVSQDPQGVRASSEELQGVTPGIQFSPGVEGSFQWWPVESGTMCVSIREDGSEAELPYEWRLNIVRNSPEPAGFEVTELQDRISELESQLKQKNQTISELESRISELESQSSDGSGGDVTIQVTVTPANGQQNFVEGGEAVVQAESGNADVNEMSVEYGAGTYQLNSSGQVAIPLAETGTQEMSLVYGDTTKRVSINVQEQQAKQVDRQQDGTTTGGSDFGFGLVAAVLALLAVIVFLFRER